MSEFSMIPLVCADEMPDDVIHYCDDKNYPTHCSSDVVDVDLEDNNKLVAWMIEKGYKFTEQELQDGWAWIAIMGS